MILIKKVELFGGVVFDTIKSFGEAWIFLIKTIFNIFRPPFRFHLLLRQILEIGANSTIVISLIGLFTGAVLAVQGEYTLAKFGATAFTGSAVALSLIRELAPVLTALMVIGRAGSAITAEIGIMKISEQIDALRSMAIDPIKYLMTPRFLAGVIVMPLLTAIFIIIGIAGGYFVAVGLLGLGAGTFLGDMIEAVDMTDVFSGLIKGVVFGFLFGWISCYKGYTCGFGAKGVNRATTQSVVTASVAVLVVDYFITTILTQVIFR
ncbi:MAG TPA: ABC transporter permease [Oligoflexia bacterium]|nr:ABC transporter permease [Oligoflexia bacterium]HMP26877.1 ABC transporter permease [Oligoflexia bacterium]